MNVKQTTDTICSVTANPLRGVEAESVDMGSERVSETERTAAKNGIGIFPWNRFSRRYHLVHRNPISRRRRGVRRLPTSADKGGPRQRAHIAAVIWAACAIGYGLQKLTVIACKLSEKRRPCARSQAALPPLEE
jgi:hypothetical protein